MEELDRDELLEMDIVAVDKIVPLDTDNVKSERVKCHKSEGDRVAANLLKSTTGSESGWYVDRDSRYGSGNDPFAWIYIEFPREVTIPALGMLNG